jgi:hypothetical protein
MTSEAAEKPGKMGEYPEKHPAGAKAHPLLSAYCGTTEVVPCYKARLKRSFSAASEVVPCYKTAHLLSKRTSENRRNH